VLQRPWGFSKRAYYPPPDPINALLSFGYTLLLNEVLGVVQGKGLDPYLGFFHTVQHGRPSLALDLEEEFRAVVVDAAVLELLDAQAVAPADFTQPADKPGAIYAGEGVRRRFVEAYETRMNQRVVYGPTQTQETLRRCVALQVDQLARVLLGEQPAYPPFVWT
jgi:CRISP-associated protein Cas1